MVGLPGGEKLFGGRQRGGAVPMVGKNNLRFTEGSRSGLKQVQLIESLLIFGKMVVRMAGRNCLVGVKDDMFWPLWAKRSSWFTV